MMNLALHLQFQLGHSRSIIDRESMNRWLSHPTVTFHTVVVSVLIASAMIIESFNLCMVYFSV